MAKKHDLSEKKISVCHAPLPPVLDEICLDATDVALEFRKLKFRLPESFCQLDAPYTQNFEIWNPKGIPHTNSD
jgi:hypothetical protein